MNYELLESAAALRHLTILGGFHPTPSDDVPEGFQTLLLLGPDEAAGFWAHVTGGPEFADGAPDPVDRWSRRVIGDWADEIG
ncbi:MAG: ferredoxin, partial [Pseudomonadota bacterium]